MTPPPADQIASRVLLGPALRAQPDRRLVTLVREGYEAAFDEIVRRYRRPLDRFAAAIVGGRSEDVTQDALSKALLALRGSEAEIELRPWLYRIVRNTALNDLRDSPPAADQLEDAGPGGPSAAEAAERREEMSELVERLRALPEPQRAAIVMRELEGLSHDEIAAALGVSGGAARQAIHRAREALRTGLGALIPLPLLRLLIDHGAEAAVGAGGAAAAGAAGAGVAGGGGAVLGGLGAGGAIKAGVATVLVAGSVGAGAVAIHNERDGGGGPAATRASAPPVRGGDGARASGAGPSGDPRLAVAAGTAESAQSHRDRGHKRREDGGGGEGRSGPSGADRGSGSARSGREGRDRGEGGRGQRRRHRGERTERETRGGERHGGRRGGEDEERRGELRESREGDGGHRGGRDGSGGRHGTRRGEPAGEEPAKTVPAPSTEDEPPSHEEAEEALEEGSGEGGPGGGEESP